MFFLNLFKKNKKKTACCQSTSVNETPKLSVIDQPPFVVLSIEKAKEIYQKSKNDYIWLDVRNHREWNNGHVPGAKHIPIDDLETRLPEVGPKDKKYIVYCHAGGRSTAACELLSEKGYNFLFNMTGGMGEWNGPLEP